MLIRGPEKVQNSPLVSFLEYVHTALVARLGQWLGSVIFPNLNDSMILSRCVMSYSAVNGMLTVPLCGSDILLLGMCWLCLIVLI